MVSRRLAFAGGMAAAIAASVPSRAAEDSYAIPVILELTGAGAFIGNSERRGVEFAETVINHSGGVGGRKIEFVFHDNQSNPQVSLQLANEVLADNPAIVLASTLRADCAAMAPLFANGPVLYCFTPSFHPNPGTYIYSEGISTRDLAVAGFRFFRAMGWMRIAFISSTDATGQDAETNLLDIMRSPEAASMTLVEDAHFNTTDVTVSAQVERMKADDPQVIIAYASGTPVATVFRGLRDAGLGDVPTVTTSANQIVSEMEQFAAFLPKRLLFFSTPWPAIGDPRLAMAPAIMAPQEEFAKIYAQENVEPDQGAVSGWEPAMLAAGALRTLGPGATASQIQAYFQHLKGVAGLSGIYDFEKTPQRGLNADNAIVTEWRPALKRFVALTRLGGAPIEK